MVKLRAVKWDKSVSSPPADNVISSDFHKFMPPVWKCMEGEPRMSLIMSNEYQRLWIAERDELHKKMYPDNDTVNVDMVKRYIQGFKSTKPAPKPEPKKPFTMKKFENIESVTKNVRPPGDKAMGYLDNKKTKPKNTAKTEKYMKK